jgi:hypothetical protein
VAGEVEGSNRMVKRCPNPDNEYTEIEIRQVFDPEDFGAEFTPSCESNKSACAHRSLRRNNHRSRKDKGAPIVF